ncbi:hypothetical protein LguiA_020491 [Lonicera macranthoides]
MVDALLSSISAGNHPIGGQMFPFRWTMDLHFFQKLQALRSSLTISKGRGNVDLAGEEKLGILLPKLILGNHTKKLSITQEIYESGGGLYSVETGRKDGLVSLNTNVNLPSSSISVSDSVNAFANKSLTPTDMHMGLEPETTKKKLLTQTILARPTFDNFLHLQLFYSFALKSAPSAHCSYFGHNFALRTPIDASESLPQRPDCWAEPALFSYGLDGPPLQK